MIGTKIKNRYKVLQELTNQGGMGFVVFALDEKTNTKVVIKFCQSNFSEELKQRFAREIRLLIKHKESGFTIPILDYSITEEPFFFVMPEAESDLTESHKMSLEQKEALFFRMIDCVSYLHQQGDLHRDIKPENFLLLNGEILLSDLGLAKDPTSQTQFTQSIDVRGTQVYAPPNFFQANGGFKNPQIADDLFSLGKTFLFLLTGQVPIYIIQGDIPDPIFEVIKKTTELKVEKRYFDCAHLARDLKSAFDTAFQRIDSGSLYFNLKRDIAELSADDFSTFIKLLRTQEARLKVKAYQEHSELIFRRVSEAHYLADLAPVLIEIYKDISDYIDEQNYWPFEYAERVANDISFIFEPQFIDDQVKADGLKIALHFAIRMNRGAAGQTCAKMLEAISEDRLAILCARAVEESGQAFVFDQLVTPEKCQHELIIKAILAARSKT